MFKNIKRLSFFMAVFCTGGIAVSLPETPETVKACIAGLCLICFALLIIDPAISIISGFNKENMKGRGKNPLLFLSAGAAAVIILFCAGFIRGRMASYELSKPCYEEFYEKYRNTNPGEFDYAMYLKGNGIKSEEERKKQEDTPAVRFRKFCGSIFDEAFSEKDSGIYKALITGDKGDLDERVSNLYKSSGISHLLAVSGLHVSIIGMGLFSILRKLSLSVKTAGTVSSCVMICFLYLSGVPGSAQRAVIMLILNFLSLMTGRTYDMKSALCLAFIVMTFNKPYIIFQSGFQLSFAAVAAICFVSDYVIKQLELTLENHEEKYVETGNQFKEKYKIIIEERQKNKKTRKRKRISHNNRIPDDGRIIITSVSIQLLTMPVIVYNYYTFPLYGIILNFIVIPLISVVMYSGLLVLFFGTLNYFLPWFSLLMKCAAAPGHYILELYEILCRLIGSLPFSNLCFGKPDINSICAYYILAGLVLYLMTKNPASKIKHKALIKGMLALITCASFAFLLKKVPSDDFYVAALDVGQGDCFFINDKNSKILIDGGCSGYDKVGSNIIEPYLLSSAVNCLDAVIISHADEDHTNGIMYLLSSESDIKVKSLWLPENALYSDKYDKLIKLFKNKNNSGNIFYLKTGDEICLNSIHDNDLRMTCLFSRGKDALQDTNSHSPFILLTKGDFSMLFTGDSSKEDERLFSETYNGNLPDVDVIKIAHHGSNTSTSDLLLKKTCPEYAILSYGRNNRFGHPGKETLERLDRYGIKQLKTAESGEIKIYPFIEERNLNLSYKQIKTVVFNSTK